MRCRKHPASLRMAWRWKTSFLPNSHLFSHVWGEMWTGSFPHVSLHYAFNILYLNLSHTWIKDCIILPCISTTTTTTTTTTAATIVLFLLPLSQLSLGWILTFHQQYSVKKWWTRQPWLCNLTGFCSLPRINPCNPLQTVGFSSSNVFLTLARLCPIVFCLFFVAAVYWW